jgi:AAA family ATPase
MSDKARFTVRPFSRPARPDLKDALRVNLSASTLLSLKLRAGDLCLLQQDGSSGRPAIAWQAVEKIQDTVIQISKVLQDLCGLKLGDKLSVISVATPVCDAGTVGIREVMQNGSSAVPADDQLSDEDRPHWEWLLHDPLSRAEHLICGLQFDSIQARGQKRSFVISQLDDADSRSPVSIRKLAPSTKVSILSTEDQTRTEQALDKDTRLAVSGTRIGGLGRQLEQINLLLRRFEPVFQALVSQYNYQPSRGLLLYGSKGTGKSLVIDELAASQWRNVIRWSAISSGRIDHGEQLLKAFSDALSQQPCLMIIEQLGALALKRSSLEGSTSSFLPAIRKGFELIRNSAVLVVSEVRHPNDIDDSLRAQTRFGIEIELPVPAANGRLEILRCIRGNADQPSEEILSDIAERTHGYVGADLVALYQRIIEIAAHRTLALQKSIDLQLNDLTLNGSPEEPFHPYTATIQPTLAIIPTDILTALPAIRPTAMQEVFLSNPSIHWHDIGGHASTKLRLRRAITRPLHHPSTMTRLNLRTNRGILLYGPPGCSKTLLVKALATESGLNFLAVKGAELVSMYVGESERAVREIFRKARAASPSIIFFDEFDSIAPARNSGGGGSGSNLNILTTLLNEMDGFEQLHNVLIVAATNRPEILDPALLRPGRLDNLVYVGPPDLQARKEILTLWLAKSDPGEDVDVGVLAGWMEGYSGAEIVSVCETAGGLAMDEEEEREKEEENEEEEKGKGGNEVKIHMQHLKQAVGEVKRGITNEVVRAYEEWGAGRGGS